MTALKFGWLLCLVSAIVSGAVLWQSPAGIEIPLHWGIDGTPDRYGPAWEGLFMPPAVMAMVLGIFSVLKWMEPRQENLEKSSKARGGIALAVVLMMLIIQAGTIGFVLGSDVPMVRLVFFAMGLMFMLMGNFLGKTRSNFFIGIRTPWTLSSDEVWRKTHRMGGKLFMAVGAVMAGIAWLVAQSNLAFVLIICVVPAVLIPAVYSWWLWRQENIASSSE